jgi:hypothetical protein
LSERDVGRYADCTELKRQRAQLKIKAITDSITRVRTVGFVDIDKANLSTVQLQALATQVPQAV